MRIIPFLLIMVFAINLQAGTYLSVEDVPNTRLQSDSIHISDPDDWISPDYEKKINDELTQIRSLADVFVVVLPSIGDQSIEVFANELFNYWGIGDTERNDGVLMLMVLDQRKLKFETGYGVESLLTDLLCQNIFLKIILPYFKEGRYSEGLYEGVCAVATTFKNPPPPPTPIDEYKAPSRFKAFFESWYEIMGFWGSLAVVLLLAFFNWLSIKKGMEKVENLETAIQSDVQSKVWKHMQVASQYLWQIPLLGVFCLCPAVLFYYPSYFKKVKRLKHEYRNKPRQCEHCGAMMRRLTEKEEDAFMTENQLFEENEIKVKDYDIWLCDQCGSKTAVAFLKDDAYDYSVCPECGCLAVKDEIVNPNEANGGKGVHRRVCQKCKWKSVKNFDLLEYTPPSWNYDNSSNDDDTNNSTSSNNDSDYSSSSGRDSHRGGSFGGGRSGGGGYTGSW